MIAFLLSGISLQAQQGGGEKGEKKEWTDGELQDVQIEIVNERKIVLPHANRNFEKIPPRPAESATAPITYDFRTFSFQAPEIKPLIRPLKLKQTTSSNVYGSYVSLGYGNYASPYAEAFLNSRKDKDKLVGAHAWLISSGKGPVDGKNSGSGNSGISLYGKTFGKVLSFSGDVGFENTSTHFYGYPEGMEVNRDSIKQSYNVFSLNGSLSNTKKTDFAYSLGAGLSYLSDKHNARETEIDLAFKSSYAIQDESSVQLKADYSAINRKDQLVDATLRNLFQVKGAYVFTPMDGFTMNAGVIVAYENDTLGGKDLHVFPDLSVTYKVTPSVEVVGALTGGIDKVSLHTLAAANWWLAPNVAIFHTDRTFEFNVGMNAKLGNKVEAHTGIALANLKNYYYFVNSPEDQSKFIVVYDRSGTKRSNLFASLSYAQSEKAKFMLRGDVYSYTTGDKELKEPWHKPLYKLSANAYYNIYDKILLKADLIMQGGMKALDPVTLETVKLDGAFDLNAKAEYLFSDSFSFFVQFNNITSNKYPLFLNYPVRGLQVLGGITWSF